MTGSAKAKRIPERDLPLLEEILREMWQGPFESQRVKMKVTVVLYFPHAHHFGYPNQGAKGVGAF